MPGDERCGGRCEKDNRTCDLHWLADAVQCRDAFNRIGVECWIGEDGVRAVSVDEGWSYGVDIDIVLAPLNGEALGKVGDASLGHTVDGLGWQGSESRLRAHIDDAAVFLFDHHPACGLACEERSLQVDGERVVEIFLDDVLCQIS